MNIHKMALEAIYGKVPDETWLLVAAKEIAPPWPLPEVLARQGLKPGKYIPE